MATSLVTQSSLSLPTNIPIISTPASIQALASLIDLNESEKEGIKRYSQGEALFVCGNRRMQINVVVTKEELESFGTGGGY